ncbi:NAD(P)H-dependent oxidoreductase [Candidatus Saccharibacteria bacterium]|nr:NAD(P)H-dependent oxidoreductase [Candidatus Saccharibacteria bacterium]
MNVFFIYAHEDPKSFGAAMHNRALSYFERNLHKVVVSDLYASGFHPIAAKWDFVVSGGAHQNYMLEQRRAAGEQEGGFATDIKDEIAKIRVADLLVIEFPLWWSAPPAIMKGWFDKVFAMGVTWDGDHRYGKGLLAGKQVLVITGTGDSESLYSPQGLHKATVTQHLYPLLHSTLAHAGLDVHKPFVAHNLTAANDDELQKYLLDLESYLDVVVSRKPEFIYKH